jgi:hypothetical protein
MHDVIPVSSNRETLLAQYFPYWHRKLIPFSKVTLGSQLSIRVNFFSMDGTALVKNTAPEPPQPQSTSMIGPMLIPLFYLICLHIYPWILEAIHNHIIYTHKNEAIHKLPDLPLLKQSFTVGIN